MDQATLQRRVYLGYQKAALRIGVSYSICRPKSAQEPLPVIGTVMASFNAQDFTYMKPNKYGNPVWYGLYDGTQTQPGDYLVGPSVFFVASQQPILPIQCVECNRAVVIAAIGATGGLPSAAGAQPYLGVCAADGIPSALGIASGATGDFTLPVKMWPASIILGGRIDRAAMPEIPSDPKQAGWTILLPPSVPVDIEAGSMVTDDLNRNYLVQAAEQTDLGWRLQCTEKHG